MNFVLDSVSVVFSNENQKKIFFTVVKVTKNNSNKLLEHVQSVGNNIISHSTFIWSQAHNHWTNNICIQPGDTGRHASKSKYYIKFFNKNTHEILFTIELNYNDLVAKYEAIQHKIQHQDPHYDYPLLDTPLKHSEFVIVYNEGISYKAELLFRKI